ncbi:DNA-binding transcriptional regulator, LysR family [Salinihabitans flavidus]|uniref:DNA-binding transcriptional regulator, LysR family n=1 Tax=Salinihabitans flavidus TaxID=569882 RepID=A0A1H8MWH4_9RHOB|nr:LysR family transcriptional regulator [Salinihabitans flavidus]SEO21598.1 DNA-binding transcriptional regulator, LysR family [Salinihabitans flavidus]
MNDRLSSLDWSLVQAFLAVAETGSLSQAARRLGASQPTLGRQIRALESQLDAELFQRVPRGLTLTALGQEVLPAAQEMRAAMGRIALTAAGGQSRLRGDVRIASSVFMAHHVLPAILARLRRAEPEIAIDLVPSDGSENLLFREADIAVRMYRPDQLDIVAQHIGEIGIGVFAARSYLERAGRPSVPEDLLHHEMVGYDRNDLILRIMRDMGFPAAREMFSVRCDNQSAYWELVRAGCGIGFAQITTGQADPGVERLLPDMALPPLPVWLSAHEAMRHTPRIRRVWQALSEGLRPVVS